MVHRASSDFSVDEVEVQCLNRCVVALWPPPVSRVKHGPFLCVFCVLIYILCGGFVLVKRMSHKKQSWICTCMLYRLSSVLYVVHMFFLHHMKPDSQLTSANSHRTQKLASY